MLTLCEELVILSIEDGKGALTPFTSETLRYGLAGAILAELVLQEKARPRKVQAGAGRPDFDRRTDSGRSDRRAC